MKKRRTDEMFRWNVTFVYDYAITCLTVFAVDRDQAYDTAVEIMNHENGGDSWDHYSDYMVERADGGVGPYKTSPKKKKKNPKKGKRK
jgi:hypothetical protein